MRTVAIIISALSLSVLVAVSPVLSAENRTADQLQLPEKDRCLLLAMNCQDNAYNLQQRIERLRGEIAKGNLIYTDDELNILRKKLDDTRKALEFVIDEGA